MSLMAKGNPYTNYRVKINFTCREPSHSGYCSDAGSDTGEEYTDTVIIKLRKNTVLRLAKLNAVNEDNSINLNILKENNDDHIFNEILDYNKEIYCTKGSGYCGYTGYSSIDEIVIYKKINLMD